MAKKGSQHAYGREAVYSMHDVVSEFDLQLSKRWNITSKPIPFNNAVWKWKPKKRTSEAINEIKQIMKDGTEDLPSPSDSFCRIVKCYLENVSTSAIATVICFLFQIIL